ncbi:MAG: general secretion pathway protein GspK [Candidatus Binatia bacterium]
MKNERGVVLIIVLWTLMVLMVLAAELARSSRIEGLTTGVYQDEVTAYYLATAGLHRALYKVLRAQQQGRNLLNLQGGRWAGGARAGGDSSLEGLDQPEWEDDIWIRGDGQWKKEEFGAGGYWVRVIDEGGKINLNQVDEATLRQTFINLGFDQELGELLTDTIQDWRDTDPLVRLHGAENDYYQNLPIPYSAKDGPFDSVDELLLIRGVTPALFHGRTGIALNQLFTVYSAAGGTVNMLTASPLVLRAVLGVDADAARDLVRQRVEATGANVAGLFPGGVSGRGLNFGLPQIMTIESVGYLNSAKVQRRVATVVQRVGANGFRFLRWRDRVDEGDPVPAEEEVPQ